MFRLTENAKAELQDRITVAGSNQLIRLQMRKSCFMKVKVTLEETIQSNDTEITKDGLHFIIDNAECHYFNHKTLDYISDTTGFKQFDIL
ncbi:iron-sulfur cluster biosynthesis [Neobacillus sp. MER 74]|uniref:iron-sulfur cluster biosynthesis family protein n=1 Tax=unclassified Neobacillus TaxID=2675272 RepID=UPI00203A9C55|nr:iron-sulfur cluster biosynthesis family protein [Neobacillus sp. MER 74]MCM3115795.1 iron-sulfur cluster biosynthesis [Neobacillus sp. MER 74]